MNKEELLKYGNELTICGFIVGNETDQVEHVYFPLYSGIVTQKTVIPSMEEIHQIIRQMDVQDIEGLQKIVLRKSQRQIDQHVSWQVFRRDNFTCVYCGADDVPMTVDHIVLWEHMGDTVPDNLNCSCKKCNKTRGSMLYERWLESDYLINANSKTEMPVIIMSDLKERGFAARELPLRKTKRSR